MYAYYNDGMSMHSVDESYSPKNGEIIFTDIPTFEQLSSSFPNYQKQIKILQGKESYNLAIASGCQISSTSSITLSGTYGIKQSDLVLISGEQEYIITKGTFSNNQTSRYWKDVFGNLHNIPTVSEGTALFSALASYVNALETSLFAVESGGDWQPPSQPVVII